MADYFTQFSVVVPIKSYEEAAWVKKYADLFRENWEASEVWQEETLAARFEELKQEIPVDAYDRMVEAGIREVSCEIELEDIGKDLVVWVHDGGGGDVYIAAVFILVFLARFYRDDEVFLHWADTCSKPRAGAFSGGTALVTRYGIAVCGVGDQEEICRARMKRMR